MIFLVSIFKLIDSFGVGLPFLTNRQRFQRQISAYTCVGEREFIEGRYGDAV